MNLAGGDDWDDTELIKEYEKAVKGWRKSKASSDIVKSEPVREEEPVIGPWVSVKKEEKTIAVGSWVLGSPCRAIYTSDGLEYEAKIIDLGPIEGSKTCIIRFVGYGNQEKKDLSELKETFGKRSRDRQRREAQASNSAFLTPGGAAPLIGLNGDGEDYFSSVSLTSSMCNNCPSIANGGKDDDQLTTATDGSIAKESVSGSSSAIRFPRKIKSPGKRKRADETATELMNVDDQQDAASLVLDQLDGDNDIRTVGGTDDVLPSGAEATMGSSSSSDISDDDNEDGDDEATSATGAFKETLKGFPSMIPQFPFPPMPMSLADTNGKFDFGRGQLPSLLLSWYMSGYHAGFFDAKNSHGKDETSRRSKRQ